MALPEIVTREEWLAARRALLVKEKELTRARDALNAERRRLPMVEVTEDYRFIGPDGTVTLAELFEGRRQLVVHQFMWNNDVDEDGVEHPRDVGCPSCSANADDIAHLEHLHAANTTLAAITRAPYEKIAAFRERMGWTFPWYSSHDSRFGYDFWSTVDDRVAPVLLNFRTETELAAAGIDWGPHRRGDHPGVSAFLRDGDRVFHTWSGFGRALEDTGTTSAYLDLTALGRQQAWEEPAGRAEALGLHAGGPGLRFRAEYPEGT
jgi:predicted dithiol-disulfide oxidoreductase (DUF899 family)